MELNKQSQTVLKTVQKKLQARLVAYTRQGFTCVVRKDGFHKFYNEESQPRYKAPFFFNPFHKKENLRNCYKGALMMFDEKMGKLNYK